MRFFKLALAAAIAVAAIAPMTAPVAAAGRPAATALPADRLHFGLSNGPGSLAWMTASGVPWRYRYTYIAGGVNTLNPWPTWQDPALPPGQYALDYMNRSRAAGYIPMLPYYQLLQSNPQTGLGESDQDWAHLNDPAVMNVYYGDFALLMQKAGQYGGQVLVNVEPDLWGYLQQRAAGASAATLTASVASSGYASAAGMPDTVQGFAYELLKLRDTYAPNTVLGVHASMWSSGRDLASDTDPSLGALAEADKTAAFLDSAGIASNPYGSRWDVVFNDVDDHDAGWWEARGLTNASFTHWWDTGNVRFPNFARYLSWVAELRARTGRPQVAWQVPVGNQYYLTMNNTCSHYQDNIAQYFIGHAPDLYNAGLIAVLFGAGNGCQTSNEDRQSDGVTNNNNVPTTDAAGGCNACNTHVSTVADDDGGFLRVFVGQYYAAPPPPPPPVAPLYTLDGFGGVHAAGSSSPLSATAYWPGWDIARGMAVFHDGTGGYVLDAYGGLHPFGSAPNLAPYTGYWPGWDISRGVVIAPWATAADPAGWTLDGYGGLHPFGSATWVNQAGAYWPGWDIARGAVIASDSVPGNVKGYVLDGFGGLHPVGGAPNLPPYSGYWPGWDIARGVVLTTGSTSSASPGGCVLDGFGGLHSFGSTATCAGTGYWPRQDIARGVTAWSGGAGGWVLRADGVLFAFGGAPALSSNVYYGRVIARGAAGG